MNARKSRLNAASNQRRNLIVTDNLFVFSVSLQIVFSVFRFNCLKRIRDDRLEGFNNITGFPELPESQAPGRKVHGTADGLAVSRSLSVDYESDQAHFDTPYFLLLRSRRLVFPGELIRSAFHHWKHPQSDWKRLRQSWRTPACA